MRRTVTLLTVAALGLSALVVPPAARAADRADPVGAFDSLSIRLASVGPTSSCPGVLTPPGQQCHAAFGWAADPDRPNGPVEVHLYLDGAFLARTTTSAPRPDVHGAFPFAGPSAGWTTFVAVPDDGRAHVVCAYGLNVGAGTENTTLGCHATQTGGSDGDPRGVLDQVTVVAPGVIRLRGWAGDPDAPFPVFVRVYYDGRPMTGARADQPRPDVATVFPELGSATGFEGTFAIVPGRHHLCVYAGNEGRTGVNNTTLGCATVEVPEAGPPGERGPRGAFDSVSMEAAPPPSVGNVFRGRGWAYDPDATGPLPVRFRVLRVEASVQFGASESELQTGTARPDVQAAVPGAGPATGFDGIIAGGRTTRLTLACAYAESAGPGIAPERLIGCITPSP